MSHALVLNECPHGIRAISIDDEAGGVRLTGKHCGIWTAVARWPMSKKQWDEMVNTIQCETEGDE